MSANDEGSLPAHRSSEDDALRQEISVLAGWEAPLPPPDVLKAFGEAVPGADIAIVDEFKKQAAHRQAMEARESRSQAYVMRVISTSVGLVPILTVVAGTAVAVFTEGWWAGVLLVAGPFALDIRRKTQGANVPIEDSNDEPEEG